MRYCDAYFPDIVGTATERLRFLCADLIQTGAVSASYTPNTEKKKAENGGFITYARELVDKQITLTFEGGCDAIRSLADGTKHGELVISGIDIGTEESSDVLTGIHCYLDGAVETQLISRRLDMMAVSVPVIIRDLDVAVPVAILSYNGNPKTFSFAGSLMSIDDSKYMRNGVYWHPDIVIPDTTTGATILGQLENAVSGITVVPTCGIRAEGAENFTISTFTTTCVPQDATTVTLPPGDFDAYIDIRNPTTAYIKPFRMQFHVRRAAR